MYLENLNKTSVDLHGIPWSCHIYPEDLRAKLRVHSFVKTLGEDFV